MSCILSLLRRKTNLSYEFCNSVMRSKICCFSEVALRKSLSAFLASPYTVHNQKKKHDTHCYRTQKYYLIESTQKEDNLRQLNRFEQVTIFRMRTGHCKLSSHLYKLKLCDTNECHCGTSIQTVEHVLQDCPRYTEQRETIWSEGVDLDSKLWGTAADLRRTDRPEDLIHCWDRREWVSEFTSRAGQTHKQTHRQTAVKI